MKKLTVVLFENALEYKNYASSVGDKFSGLSGKSEFLGTWWIEYDEEKTYSAISGAVNHFLDNTDKTEILFGIGNKDYEGVVSKIHTEDCLVQAVLFKNL